MEGIRISGTWIYVTPIKLCANKRNLQSSTATSVESIRPAILIKDLNKLLLCLRFAYNRNHTIWALPDWLFPNLSSPLQSHWP